MSKGSKQRPRQVDRKKYESNWDKVFGKKKQKEQKNAEPDNDVPPISGAADESAPIS